MIHPTIVPLLQSYYPFRSTPAVSLTENLPPGQKADILLLGCGDAASILFTCFVDTARKIDVTCCDDIPGIHARNVLLYTLLIDDKKDQSLDLIWNIYYHWAVDDKSLLLFDTQVLKLIELSESIDMWNDSVYGSSIRFCDAESLFKVRIYWICFSSHGLTGKLLLDSLSMKKYAIDKAKAFQEELLSGRKLFNPDSSRAASPATTSAECASAMEEVFKHWWEHGTVPPRNSSAFVPNPAFLYSQKSITLHHTLSPLLGFPLCTAFTPILKGSTFSVDREGKTATEYLVASAKKQFELWASAFRKAIQNKSVIRIFSGDALTFCFTLRSCQVLLPHRARSMNLFSSNVTSSCLTLHHSDYHSDKNAAPLCFDVIDSSDLCDHLGSLNVVSLASTLLKHLESSILYTEMTFEPETKAEDRQFEFFGVHLKTMALLLGLVAPQLFTNASDRFEEDPWVYESAKKWITNLRGLHRLRWRLSKTCENSSRNIHIDAKALAIFLGKVHDAMFEFENLGIPPESSDKLAGRKAILKLSFPHYTRASFASLLNILRTTVKTNWNECVEYLYDIIISTTPAGSLRSNSLQDLFLNMHLYGVDTGRFLKPDPATKLSKKLESTFPRLDTLPDVLCVTVRIPREMLKVFTDYDLCEKTDIGIQWLVSTAVALVCNFKSIEPGYTWFNTFSSVQIVFGTWHEQSNGNKCHPLIKEDYFLLDGKADLYASVMVPTQMLLKEGGAWVTCSILKTELNKKAYHEYLGEDLCLVGRSIFHEDVHLTQFMPGTHALPNFSVFKAEGNELASLVTTAQMEDDGSEILRLVHCIPPKSQVEKENIAALSSGVNIKFKTPLKAVISFGQFSHELTFPVPVSPSNCKVSVVKGCIEVEASLFNPILEDTSLFLFPISLIKTPTDSILPLSWTSTRINLDVMPVIDLTNEEAIPWFRYHTNLMMSKRDMFLMICPDEEKIAKIDLNKIQLELKNILFNLFIYYGGKKISPITCFGLMVHPDHAVTLVFPSCLRLDLANHTVVLDCAMVPVSDALKSDPKTKEVFESPMKSLDLEKHTITDVLNTFHLGGRAAKSESKTKKDLNSTPAHSPVAFFPMSQAASKAWEALMPSLVERCRTWEHVSSCEYVLTGEVPRAHEENGSASSPICSCGVGKFPQNYLSDEITKWPTLSYILERYATRATIAPIFVDPLVEDSIGRIMMIERMNFSGRGEIVGYGGYWDDEESSSDSEGSEVRCATCGSTHRKHYQDGIRELLTCSRCKRVKYCSQDCQKKDWKSHKPSCR
ncbi:unnamed protein product [Bemisia tabaci]|uniref:MYND-type domain-containing protein n=1 Tax=Bemisia tabaci TaxID=7038 RepID=A0A9P0A4E6_BEMTA|nr:unnamed protein product [Bemisia tabaci]